MPMSFIVQTLKSLWVTRPSGLFWPTWLTITAAATICVAVAVRQRAAEGSRKSQKCLIEPMLTWRQVRTPSAVATLTLLAVFLVSYIALILVWEDFAYYDDSIFTLHTLQGHDYPPPIWRGEGRFFPLSVQEFNLIRHFTDTVIGYYFLPIIQLLIFSFILLILDVELSITARAILAILVLMTPSILISFNNLHGPEHNILFLLACLVLFVSRFERTQSIASAVVAVVCVQLMIYCKETAFLLVLGFAAGRLILRCRAASGAGWDYNRLWERQSRLDLCLAALAVLFLFYYAAGMGLYHYVEGKEVVLYGQGTKHPRAITALTYAKTDCLAWIFIALFLGRICLLACRRVAPWPLWDGLACGGAAYFFVVLYISMFNTYYLAPVDLIAVLYVGRFVILSWPKMHRWGAVAALVLAFTALLQGVVYSALAVFERKNYIHAKSEIATVIKDRYMSGLPSPLKLYFPFAGPYEIMQFGSYLNYRGVPVEGATEEAAAARSIVLATPAVTNNGPCLNWEPVVCHAASSPAPGDLLVVLPNDGASAEEASIYRKSGELLLYEPFPCISQRWYFILKILALPVSFVSDRWMDGSVTLWK